MLRSFLIVFFLCASFFTEFTYAQKTDNDLRVWEDVNAPDTLRLLALDDLINRSVGRDADSAEVLSYLMIDFAHETGNKDQEGIAIRWLARVYETQGRTLESLNLLAKSEELALETGNKQHLSSTYTAFGIVHNSMSNYSLSIENYLKSLKINEELGKPLRIAKSYRNIGIGFGNIKDFDKAEEYYLKGLELVEKEGLDSQLPGFYNSLGSLKRSAGQAEEALVYYRKIIAMGDSISNQKFIGAAYHNVALTYWEGLGQLDSALVNFEKSLEEKERIGWASAYGSTYTGLGGVNSHMGNYETALPWCIKSLAEARKKRSLVVEMNGCGCLYEAYKGLGKLDSALKYHELMEVMKDSLINVDREREINRKELGYNFEKKAMADSLAHQSEQAILVEKTEKQRLGLLAAGGGLLLLLTLAYSIYSGKKKSDELLLNILPYETAQELKQKGHSDARLIDEVTVLFTDFKGFTAMSEQLSPKDLVEDLNICFSEFDRIMEKYGIEKIKTIGDAYMAASGLPSPNDDHAQNAVKAAFEMRDFIETGKARKLEKGLPYFEIRIGVHTGPVVAGIVGIKKFQYDIWGDTVNTASRMESSGEVGKVNISETTYELVKDQFLCEHRGKVEAKGKGRIDMYFIEKPRSA